MLLSLLSVYEHQGYHHGYDRAVQNLLASLVPTTEAFIRRHNASTPPPASGTSDVRRLLYQFVQHLEQHIQEMPRVEGYVSDGLGI